MKHEVIQTIQPDHHVINSLSPFEELIFLSSRLDTILTDDHFGFVTGQPWVTLLVDRYSGYPIWVRFGFEPPCATTVAQRLSLLFLVQSNISVLNNDPWINVLPKKLSIDKQFVNEFLIKLCALYTIEINSRPVNNHGIFGYFTHFLEDENETNRIIPTKTQLVDLFKLFIQRQRLLAAEILSGVVT